MDPRTIKYLLNCKNQTQASIARALKVAPSVVSAVVSGNARSRRVENRIAVLLALPLNDIWPQWYDDDGRRKAPNRARINPTEALAALQRQAA